MPFSFRQSRLHFWRGFAGGHHQANAHQQFRARIIFAGLSVVLAFSLLFGRFAYLQVFRHDYYATRADGNRISLVPIAPNRGVIYDRNGVIMARNYPAFTLEITASKLVEPLEDVIEKLAQIVTIQPKDKRDFQKELAENKRIKSLASIAIRSRLSDEEVARFTAQRYLFPGVEVNARLFREYPLSKLAAHVLGYINRTTKKDELKIETAQPEQEANYKGTNHFGQTGLEQKYEFQLHGTTGYEEIETDARGNLVRSLSQTLPVAGSDLSLTLDTQLQAVAEKAFGDRRGALVAIEPATGEVLAMVSMPNFDPNLFIDGISHEDWAPLINSPDTPLLNRAINGTYPPGSTYKPFFAIAALEQGKRTPTQTIFDPGYFTLGNNTFRDSKRGGRGIVDLHKSIVVSSDTYYYQLAHDMGIDNIARFMGNLGFGQKTGIDLEGESEGILPSPEWKKSYFKDPRKQKWLAGDTISIGIGQGFNNFTLIQLAQAMATLANDGVLNPPHLVKKITNSKTGEETRPETNPARNLHWQQKYIDLVKKAMVGVNKEGTGARAFAGAPYTSGGKTGTAQVFDLKGSDYKAGRLKKELHDHALFIAFAPADKPKIALALLVENGGFGAQAAAPIARMVIDYYLLGQTPNGPALVDKTAIEDGEARSENDENTHQASNPPEHTEDEP